MSLVRGCYCGLLVVESDLSAETQHEFQLIVRGNAGEELEGVLASTDDQIAIFSYFPRALLRPDRGLETNSRASRAPRIGVPDLGVACSSRQPIVGDVGGVPDVSIMPQSKEASYVGIGVILC